MKVPSADPRHILAIDLGTSGAKVGLVTTTGHVVGFEKEPVDLILGDGGLAEQDPNAWWQAICRASCRLLARRLVPLDTITAACAGAQWGCTVAVDASGKPLRHAHSWLDQRGSRHARHIVGGWDRIPGTPYSARKLVTWLRRTGGAPSADGKDPVGHINWIRTEQPDIYAATRWFLDVPEYLTLCMSGRAVASYDTIVARWCTDNRDLTKIHYDKRLLSITGLDHAKLPEIVPSASIVGLMTSTAKVELGLPDTLDIAVIAGVGDTVAAGIGSGAVDEYHHHLYIGTSAWYSCHMRHKRADLSRTVFALPSAVPHQYWVAAIQESAGKTVEWLLDNVIFDSDEFATAERSDDALARLNAVGMSAPPGSNGVIFTPWLNGERTPIEDSTIRGGWHNLSLTSRRADLVRSVIEGVVFNCRWMAEAVEGLSKGLRPRGAMAPIRFIGGGAISPLWCQIVADIFDRPIAQVRDPVVANLRGAGILGAIGTGHLQWSEVAGAVEIAETFIPNPLLRQRYDDMFKAFTQIYKRNKPIHKCLHRDR
nr:FGGY-family carbohydrate kinase [Rhodanobacter sp. A1T4]